MKKYLIFYFLISFYYIQGQHFPSEGSVIQIQGGWQNMGVLEFGWAHKWESSVSSSGDFIRLDFPGNQQAISVLGSTAYHFAEQQAIVGLQTGYTYYWTDFSLLFGVQTAGYSDMNIFDLRVIPEVGIHIWGHIYLKYGYAQPLLKDPISMVGRHRILIGINFTFSDPDKRLQQKIQKIIEKEYPELYEN